MKRGLARREREDQPAVAGIDRIEAKNVAEKDPVRLSVLRIHNYVRT
jgi:hypothetical protein